MVDEKQIVEKIKAAKNAKQVFDVVAKLQFAGTSSRLSSIIDKKLKSLNEVSNIRIALLGNFTLDFLPPNIAASFSTIRMISDCYVAPYGQHYQEVLSENSQLRAFNSDVVFLSLTLRELSAEIYYHYSEMSQTQRLEQSDQVLEHMENWINLAIENLPSRLLVANFILPHHPQLGFADNREEETEVEFYQHLNKRLRQIIARYDRVSLVDLATLAGRVGWQHSFDAKMYYMAKLHWGESLMQEISLELLKFVVADRGLTKKCLVLDLDNTLWGGVLGEDGINGVKIGKGDPVSEAFTDFQYKLKALKQRGIVLAICSKNNHEDVLELFTERKDLPLKLDDFSSTRINWEMKHKNIIEIADELNIGIDSLVFIDDNPAEINLVQTMLPEVVSILLPKSPEKMPALIDALPIFEKSRIIDEDRQKTQQYSENSKRTHLKNQTSNLDDYLNSLGTTVTLRSATPDDVPRIHQLFLKTNQFNLTTIRYSIDDIQRLLNNNESDLWCYSVEDNFGDLGIVGLMLVHREINHANIDSLLMSCRAMGRGIETAIFNWLKNYYFNFLKFRKVTSNYLPTKKNKPVAKLYIEQGFQQNGVDGEKINYLLNSNESTSIECDWIELKSEV